MGDECSKCDTVMNSVHYGTGERDHGCSGPCDICAHKYDPFVCEKCEKEFCKYCINDHGCDNKKINIKPYLTVYERLEALEKNK